MDSYFNYADFTKALDVLDRLLKKGECKNE